MVTLPKICMNSNSFSAWRTVFTRSRKECGVVGPGSLHNTIWKDWKLSFGMTLGMVVWTIEESCSGCLTSHWQSLGKKAVS